MMVFFVNFLLLIMGVVVFKFGSVKDFLFFGLFDVLLNLVVMSNFILVYIVGFGILLILFVVVLLVLG